MSVKPRVVEREESAAEPAGSVTVPAGRGRRDVLVLAGLAVAVLAGIGGYMLLTRGQAWTDNAQVEADVVPLNTRVGGPVLHVRVADNSLVRKGDVLVEIDPSEYSIRVEQATAELESAQAQDQAAEEQATVVTASARGGHSTARALVAASTTAVSSFEAQVDVARAALARAEAEASRAALELERIQRLRAGEVATQRELDEALSSHAAAQAALAGARAQLAVAERARQESLSRVAEAQGQLEQNAPVDAKIAAARANAALARARVRAATAALAHARLMLEQIRIVAPTDGKVSRLSVREGQLLSAGQPVAQLVPQRTYVIANFKETQVGDIRPGQRVEVTVDAFPGVKLQGQVESVSGGTGTRFSLLPPDNATGNFVKVVQRVPVRISWADPPAELPLQAGLSVEVTVFTQSTPERTSQSASPPARASR